VWFNGVCLFVVVLMEVVGKSGDPGGKRETFRGSGDGGRGQARPRERERDEVRWTRRSASRGK